MSRATGAAYHVNAADPVYYAHREPSNSAGPRALDLSPPHLADAAELRGDPVGEGRHEASWKAWCST